jgi:hypothetical protein
MAAYRLKLAAQALLQQLHLSQAAVQTCATCKDKLACSVHYRTQSIDSTTARWLPVVVLYVGAAYAPVRGCHDLAQHGAVLLLLLRCKGLCRVAE